MLPDPVSQSFWLGQPHVFDDFAFGKLTSVWKLHKVLQNIANRQLPVDLQLRHVSLTLTMFVDLFY